MRHPGTGSNGDRACLCRAAPQRRKGAAKDEPGHGVLTVDVMEEVHLELQTAVCRAMLELCDAVGASVMAHHPGKVPTAVPAREAAPGRPAA